MKYEEGVNAVYAISLGCPDVTPPCLGEPVLLFTYPILLNASMSWSPDGLQVAFDGLGVGKNFDIFVSDWMGEHIVNITESPLHDDMLPTWSPDGERIAFASSGEDGYQIISSDPDGLNRSQLLIHANVNSPYAPNWSIDGKQLVFSGKDDTWYPQHIYISDLDGSNLNQITHNAELESYTPFFSPDGSWIVFTRDVKVELGGLNHNLYLIRSDGTGETKLLDDKDSIHRSPAWSPLEDWIAFGMLSFDEEGSGAVDIYLIKPDGTHLFNVTNTPDVNESGLAWRVYYTP